MKRILADLFLILLLLCPAAQAEDDWPFGLTPDDGQLCATLTTCFDEGRANGKVIVDCPLPEAPYPDEILTLGQGSVSKEQMQAALRAAGQSTQGQFVNPRGSAFYSGDWSADAAADVTREEAADRAVQIGLAYFDALGVEVEREPNAISRPYDYDAYIERHETIYAHRFSDPSHFMDSARAMWQRMMKHEKKQPGYTRVDFTLTVEGLRLWETPAYPAHYADDPDAWVCTPVGAYVIVSDSGVLVEASCDLFEVRARRPLEGDAVYAEWLSAFAALHRSSLLPARSWQTALHLALTSPASALTCGTEDAPFQSASMAEPVIAFGHTTVITAIRPVLSAISGDDWAPFWTLETADEYADGWRAP